MRRTGPILALVGAVGLLCLIGSSVSAPWRITDRLGSLLGTPPPRSMDPPPIGPGQPLPSLATERPVPPPPVDLSWLQPILITVVVLAIIAALGYLGWRIWRRYQALRPDPEAEPVGVGTGVSEAPAPDMPALLRGADAARALLERIEDPDDAIIRAWLALEEAAGAAGFTRDRAATPSEFTVTVIDRTPVNPETVRTLLTLYLQARFGSQPSRPDDVRTAKRCLIALADRWSAADQVLIRHSRRTAP